MAEDKGYWFTTKTGVHVHVEPGQSKEEALYKKFATKEQKSAKTFEPLGGFQKETVHTTKVYDKLNNSYEYERNTKPTDGLPYYYQESQKYADITHNGETGSIQDMYKKYGRTAEQVLRDTPITKEDRAVQRELKKDIRDSYEWGEKRGEIKMPTGHTNWSDYHYSKAREDNRKEAAYTEKIYSSHGKEIAQIDSTGAYKGNFSDAIKSADKSKASEAHDEEFYIRKYYKGSNFNPNFKSGSTNESRTAEVKKSLPATYVQSTYYQSEVKAMNKIYNSHAYKNAVKRNSTNNNKKK